jgi:hypothetical protein
VLPYLVVIAPLYDWTCSKCGGTGDFLLMDGTGPLCRRCAKLDHLVYLPAGDAALSRRARQASGLSAIVVRFSRSREALRAAGHPDRRIRPQTSGGGGRSSGARAHRDAVIPGLITSSA